jgi:hypothetical protein
MSYSGKIILFLLPFSVFAQECVLQQKVVNKYDQVITEVGNIRKDVVPWSKNQKKCLVNFKAMIEGNWHAAQGEYIWDGEMPVDQACGAAVVNAKRELTQRIKPATIISEDILVCNDDTTQATLKEAKIGTLVDIAQLRSHPNYPKRFYHNGAECKWFLDSTWTGKDIRQWQGVACKVEPTKWVVVDKF